MKKLFYSIVLLISSTNNGMLQQQQNAATSTSALATNTTPRPYIVTTLAPASVLQFVNRQQPNYSKELQELLLKKQSHDIKIINALPEAEIKWGQCRDAFNSFTQGKVIVTREQRVVEFCYEGIVRKVTLTNERVLKILTNKRYYEVQLDPAAHSGFKIVFEYRINNDNEHLLAVSDDKEYILRWVENEALNLELVFLRFSAKTAVMQCSEDITRIIDAKISCDNQRFAIQRLIETSTKNNQFTLGPNREWCLYTQGRAGYYKLDTEHDIEFRSDSTIKDSSGASFDRFGSRIKIYEGAGI